MPESEKTVVVGMTPDALAGTISQAIGGSGGRYDSLPEYFDQMQATLESIDEGVMTIYDAVVDRFASMGGSVAPDGTTGGLAVPFAVPEGADAFSAFLEAVREGVRSANESYALAAEGNESAAGAAQRAAESAKRVAEGSGAVAEASEKVAEAGEKAAEASSRSARAHGRAAEAAEAAAEAAEQADGPVGRFGDATDRVLARLKRSLSTAAEDIAKSNEELSRIQAQLDELGDDADEARVAELERARRKAEVDRLEAGYRVAQVNAQTAYAEGDEAAYRSAMDDVRAARGAYEQASSAYEAEGQPRRSGATTALDWLQYATGDVLDNAPRMWRDIDRGNYGDLANVLGSLTQGAGDLLGGGGSISQKILGGGVGAALSFASKALPFVGGLATTLGAYGNFMNYWDESNHMAAQYGMQAMPEFALSRAGMGLQSMWTGYTTGLSAEQAQRIQAGIMAGGADFGTQEYQQGYDFVVDAYRNTGMSSEKATQMYVDQVLKGARSVEELTASVEGMQEAVNNTTLTFDELSKMREDLTRSVESKTGGDTQVSNEVADILQDQLSASGVSEGIVPVMENMVSQYDWVNDSYAAGRWSHYVNRGYSQGEALLLAAESLNNEGYRKSSMYRTIMTTPIIGGDSIASLMEEAQQYQVLSESWQNVFDRMVAVVEWFLANQDESSMLSRSRFVTVMRDELGISNEYMDNAHTIAEQLLGVSQTFENVEQKYYPGDSQYGSGPQGATKDVTSVIFGKDNIAEGISILSTLRYEQNQVFQGGNGTRNEPDFESAFDDPDTKTAVLSLLWRNGYVSDDEAVALYNDPSLFNEVIDNVTEAYFDYVRGVIADTPEGKKANYRSYNEWLTDAGNAEVIAEALRSSEGKMYESLGELIDDKQDDSQWREGGGQMSDEQLTAYADEYLTGTSISENEFIEDVKGKYESGAITLDQKNWLLTKVAGAKRAVNGGTTSLEESGLLAPGEAPGSYGWGYSGEGTENEGEYDASDLVESIFYMPGFTEYANWGARVSGNAYGGLNEEERNEWLEAVREQFGYGGLDDESKALLDEVLAPVLYNTAVASSGEASAMAPGLEQVKFVLEFTGDAKEVFTYWTEEVTRQENRDAAKE